MVFVEPAPQWHRHAGQEAVVPPINAGGAVTLQKNARRVEVDASARTRAHHNISTYEGVYSASLVTWLPRMCTGSSACMMLSFL